MGRGTIKNPKCKDSRTCFAKENGECTILTSCYKENKSCPFCKKENPKFIPLSH